jgi:hypothetical protein
LSIAAPRHLDEAIVVFRQGQDHLKRAVTLDQRVARPMKRLVAPSSAAEPLHNPLDVVRAVDDPQITIARYDALIAFVSLSFAVTLKRDRKGGF